MPPPVALSLDRKNSAWCWRIPIGFMDVLWFSPIDLGAIPGFLAAFSKKKWLGGFLTEFRPPKSLELRTDHRRRNRIPPKEEESAADGGSAPIKVWIQGKNMETWWNFNNFRLYHGLVYLTLFPIIKSRKGRDIYSVFFVEKQNAFSQCCLPQQTEIMVPTCFNHLCMMILLKSLVGGLEHFFP